MATCRTINEANYLMIDYLNVLSELCCCLAAVTLIVLFPTSD